MRLSTLYKKSKNQYKIITKLAKNIQNTYSKMYTIYKQQFYPQSINIIHAVNKTNAVTFTQIKTIIQ